MFEPASPERRAPDADPWREARHAMVECQIAARGIRDTRVLAAMRDVPRHRFVPESQQAHAYEDTPLPIGDDQTISQPYIVALMTEVVRPAASDHVLDIGTGSGYQAAIMARLVRHVRSIERHESLARRARVTLDEVGCGGVVTVHGDGYLGWPDGAPYDIIIVAAAPSEIPRTLVDQLAPGGRMVVPVGAQHDVQHLLLLDNTPDGTLRTRNVAPVRFVPMRGGCVFSA